MKVGRPQTALKREAAQGAGEKHRELILRREWGERIFQKNQRALAARGVGRRSVNRVGKVIQGGARIEDTVAAAQNQASGVKRRVGKAYSRSEVIRVKVREDPLANIRHFG